MSSHSVRKFLQYRTRRDPSRGPTGSGGADVEEAPASAPGRFKTKIKAKAGAELKIDHKGDARVYLAALEARHVPDEDDYEAGRGAGGGH